MAVQKYFQKITDFVFVRDIQMQKAVVSIMTDIVKQGLIPPSMCIPTVVTLSTSPVAPISRRSSCLLESILMRHPNLLQNREIEIMKLVLNYHTDIKDLCLQSGKLGTSGSHFDSILSNFRKIKTGFYRIVNAMIRCFQWKGDYDIDNIPALERHVQQCIYLANNIATINYIRAEEIRTVITLTDQTIYELDADMPFEEGGSFDESASIKAFNIAVINLLLLALRDFLQINPLMEPKSTANKLNQSHSLATTSLSPQDLINFVNTIIENVHEGRWSQEHFEQVMSAYTKITSGEVIREIKRRSMVKTSELHRYIGPVRGSRKVHKGN
ncbi:sister chromatid cohesion C-terminus-domain-containing protein [Umbelopsis sp. PMI_123]|nr:sister chromatid cohesion C-terminus-domain-containing protein [Umbelopsis sp. PMI_123]